MLLKPLRNDSRHAQWFWLGLTLLVAACYALLNLIKAFSGDFVVQDDARQHVFWMQRFIDPGLFPKDLIADYFQAVAPYGYQALYRFFAVIGIDPFLFNKILPVFLGLLISFFAFRLFLRLFPVHSGAFIATVLLNQSIWWQDDMASGTPRAFAILLLLLFINELVKNTRWKLLIVVILQGLFYPPVMLISLAFLGINLIKWENGRFHFSRLKLDYWRFCLGLFAGFLILFPYKLETLAFEPVVAASEARTMPEFQRGGRMSFFTGDTFSYYLKENNSGFFNKRLRKNCNPLIWLSLLLPLLFLRRSRSFPLVEKLTTQTWLLARLFVASGTVFIASHLLLFKLYIPDRYTIFSLTIIVCFAAGVVLTCIQDLLWQFGKNGANAGNRWHKIVALAGLISIGGVILFFPFYAMWIGKKFPNSLYVTGKQPALYQFLSQQPKDSLIATLSPEASMIPTFSRQSVLFAPEYGIPFHLGYYKKFRQRVEDLIRAQYSASVSKLVNFIRIYGINFLIVDKKAFSPSYISEFKWLRQFQPEASEALNFLQQGQTPALSSFLENCSIFQTDQFWVVDCACIVKSIEGELK